jgi:SEC-C motif-containing protein
MSSKDCPCGTGRTFAECCGPRHDGSRPAETAEALMRARYAAFATGNGAYVVATQAQSVTGTPETVSAWARARTWLGLRIIRAERGGERDARGLVEFEARYKDGEQERTLREVSRFDRADGRWRYLEGKIRG